MMLWFLHFHCIKNATHLHFVARFALQRTVQWPSRLTHTETHTGGVGTTVKHILHKQREIVTGRRVADAVMLLPKPKLMRMRDQRPTSGRRRRRSHIHCSTAELQIALIVRLSSVQFGCNLPFVGAGSSSGHWSHSICSSFGISLRFNQPSGH